MPELLFIVPAGNLDTLHRTLSMLSFQKDHDFRTCVVNFTGSGFEALEAEFEQRLRLSVVMPEQSGAPLWQSCLEAAPAAEWVCFLGTDVDLTADSVRRMRRCIKDHSSYDVFHWNLADPHRKYGLKTAPGKLFCKVFVDGEAAPLSSFVFRAQTLRDAFAADPEAAGMDLAVVLSGAKKTGIRSARRERVGYRPAEPAADPALMEKEIRARLAFFRWSERFFGDDYPLGTGDRLDLFARTLAQLYPSYTQEELKEDLNTFAVVSGPVRKMRASSALKSALKQRQESLR